MHGGNDEADGCADDGAPPLLGSVYAGESERAASIASGGEEGRQVGCPQRRLTSPRPLEIFGPKQV
jgi:hypothetical protein